MRFSQRHGRPELACDDACASHWNRANRGSRERAIPGLPKVSSLPPAACRLQPAACRLPPAACRLPPPACRLPPPACRLPPPASRLPPAASRLQPAASPPPASRLPPPACRLPPAASRLQPAASPASRLLTLLPPGGRRILPFFRRGSNLRRVSHVVGTGLAIKRDAQTRSFPTAILLGGMDSKST